MQQGLQATLRGNYPEERPLRRKVDGRVEAHLIALACGPAPQGQRRWTMQLLADRVVDLGIVDQISDETVRLALKKRIASLAEASMVLPSPRERLCVAHGRCPGCLLPPL